jgi:rubredoxin
MKYICSNCGYIYDPEEGDVENGIDPGVEFDDLPEDWICPICYVAKELFDPLD